MPNKQCLNGGLGRPVNILMIEDNKGDANLAQEALSDAKVQNKLVVIGDGQAGIDYLYGKPPYEQRTLPDLVLLDLNLPKKDGRQVLEEVKKHPRLKLIPIVILTSSQAEQDIVKSYDLSCNAYVTKPLDLEQFIGVIKAIEGFWLSVVKLPVIDEH